MSTLLTINSLPNYDLTIFKLTKKYIYEKMYINCFVFAELQALLMLF